MKRILKWGRDAVGFITADLAQGIRGFRSWARDVRKGFHVKHLQSGLGIFLIILLGLGWLIGAYFQLATVKSRLGVGKEARVKELLELSGREPDRWKAWLYCRKVLEIDPDNDWAGAGRERIQVQLARQARGISAQGGVTEAIPVMVRAIQVNPEAPGLWSELEKWVRNLHSTSF